MFGYDRLAGAHESLNYNPGSTLCRKLEGKPGTVFDNQKNEIAICVFDMIKFFELPTANLGQSNGQL